jgi:G patch domain-containing protein 1
MFNRLTFRQEDDENVGPIVYGTPLPPLQEDEVAPKKADIDLTVRDEKGRRRFHGAFTGGFSAGYWNTVGSKEGWVPSQFISSRKDPGNYTKQSVRARPEDFMDDEDFNMVQGIAPKRIKTTDTFSSDPSMDFMSRLSAFPSSSKGDDSLSLADFLKGTVKPTKMSIGIKLLKKMKITSRKLQEEKEKASNEGKKSLKKSSDKKSYGCSLPPGFEASFSFESDSSDEEDNDIEVTYDSYKLPFEVKKNTHGLGYKGMLTPIGSSDISSTGPALSASIGGRRLKITGNAFGTGVLEDEDGHDYMDGADNVYDVDDMTKYDFEMRAPLKVKEKDGLLAITDSNSHSTSDMFEKESQTYFRSACSYLKKKYPSPKIPRDWRPKAFYQYPSEIGSSDKHTKKSRWDDPERKKSDPETSSGYKRTEDKPKIIHDSNSRRLLMGESLPIKRQLQDKSTSDKKESSDSSAQDKLLPSQQLVVNRKSFSGFLASKFTTSQANLTSSMLDDNDVKLEAGLTMSSDLTVTINREKATSSRRKEETEDIILLGTKRRTQGVWFPDKLLCKRFNVPVPSVGISQGIPASFSAKGSNNKS